MSDIVQQLRDLYPTHPVVMQAADEIGRLRALLQELIDIEGPQPGTAEWAAKVRVALGT